MLLTSQSVIQKYWVINSLPLLIWEAPTICERQFVTALVLRFSKQTITSIVPNSAYIWRKKKKEKTHHKAKAMSNTKTLVLQNYPATKTVSIAEVFFLLVVFFLPFFLFILFFFSPAFSVSKERWKLHTIQLHLWAVYIGLILMCWIIIDGWGSSALLVNQ